MAGPNNTFGFSFASAGPATNGVGSGDGGGFSASFRPSTNGSTWRVPASPVTRGSTRSPATPKRRRAKAGGAASPSWHGGGGGDALGFTVGSQGPSPVVSLSPTPARSRRGNSPLAPAARGSSGGGGGGGGGGGAGVRWRPATVGSPLPGSMERPHTSVRPVTTHNVYVSLQSERVGARAHMLNATAHAPQAAKETGSVVGKGGHGACARYHTAQAAIHPQLQPTHSAIVIIGVCVSMSALPTIIVGPTDSQ